MNINLFIDNKQMTSTPIFCNILQASVSRVINSNMFIFNMQMFYLGDIINLFGLINKYYIARFRENYICVELQIFCERSIEIFLVIIRKYFVWRLLVICFLIKTEKFQHCN